jgi:hypothetical protein
MVELAVLLGRSEMARRAIELNRKPMPLFVLRVGN